MVADDPDPSPVGQFLVKEMVRKTVEVATAERVVVKMVSLRISPHIVEIVMKFVPELVGEAFAYTAVAP
jgi:hypothetical protein